MIKIPEWSDSEAKNNKYSLHLYKICEKCEGLSGRALRKLPFLAHAFFIQLPNCTIQEFLNALEKCIIRESIVRQQLEKESK